LHELHEPSNETIIDTKASNDMTANA